MPRILVIDDSSLMRNLVRGALEALGYEVEDFLPVSPLEVVERIRANRPDLVLTDYHMPHVDGQMVARMARRADPGIKVAMLTAVRDRNLEQAMGALGVRHFLHKPMTAEAIAQGVRAILEG
jgi:CheY-like chemotaxis protein